VIWNRDGECLERDDLRKAQAANLAALVEKIYRRVPFYRKKLDEA
jgi:phenylacetate-CoA ligase